MGNHSLKTQVVLEYLPGYMFDGRSIVSTGAALPPTQHIDQQTGELIYYVRPLFDGTAAIGMFVRHNGILDAIAKTKGED